MIKLRLSGTKTQLARMLQLLRTSVEIIEDSGPIQNSHSNLYRIYVTVQDIEAGPMVETLRRNNHD